MSNVESDDEAKFADLNTEIDGVQLLSCFFPFVVVLIGRPFISFPLPGGVT
jgi:hypothetical protein